LKPLQKLRNDTIIFTLKGREWRLRSLFKHDDRLYTLEVMRDMYPELNLFQLPLSRHSILEVNEAGLAFDEALEIATDFTWLLQGICLATPSRAASGGEFGS
jgi:hypothetical protein